MTVYGPYDLSAWKTMLMLREDNDNMKKLDESKHAIAIKCNNNCLKEFYRQTLAA